MKNSVYRIVVLSVMTLSGCAPDYSKPVGELSKTSDKVVALRQGIKDRQLAVRGDYFEAKAIIEGQPLQPTAGCSGLAEVDSSTCYLAGRNVVQSEAQLIGSASSPPSELKAAVIRSFTHNGPFQTSQQAIEKLDVPSVCKAQADSALDQPAKTTAAIPIPTEADVIAAIKRYIAALEAITNTADADAYNVKAAKLADTVGTLATTLGTLAGGVGGAIGPVVKAVVKIGEDAYLQILERRRYEALKAAVLGACIPFHNLAYAESVILSADNSNTNHAEENILSFVQQAPKNLHREDRDRLDTLGQRAATAIRARTKLDPGEAALDLYKLHNQLVIDVLSGKGESEAFLKLLGTMAGDLKSLEDSVAKKKPLSGIPIASTN